MNFSRNEEGGPAAGIDVKDASITTIFAFAAGRLIRLNG
jgi:hypothetical protein